MNQPSISDTAEIPKREALLMVLRIFRVAEILARYTPEFSTDRDEIHLQNHEPLEIGYRETEDQ